MILKTDFTSTNRHFLVNVTYGLCWLAFVFICVVFEINLICGNFGLSIDIEYLNDLSNNCASPSGKTIFCLLLAFTLGPVLGFRLNALVMVYFGLSHLFTALKKIASFIKKLIKEIILWADHKTIL